jgi:glycolate oxidase FAD binding subunit
MSTVLAPASVAELREVVRSCPRLLAFGAGTKTRLSQVEVPKLSMTRLAGMVEYEPSEFTFTAMAGTPVRQLVESLSARGQCLPFDPILLEAGATLGGTVAAGLSGPGRLRFGGIRDFIIGAQFVDGLGRLLRVGGKVVKNAAGFDLPKFFVGSLGRFGVLTELTFKVFPFASSTLTLKLGAPDAECAARIMVEAARARWEPQALDILPGSCDVYLRLAGPAQALDQIAKEILSNWPGEKLTEMQARVIWSDLNEFRWAYPSGLLAKIVFTPAVLPMAHRELQSLDGVRIHVSSGGNVAFVSLPSVDQSSKLNQVLCDLSLPAVTLRGEALLWLGAQPRPKILDAVKRALDPDNRFPGLDD